MTIAFASEAAGDAYGQTRPEYIESRLAGKAIIVALGANRYAVRQPALLKIAESSPGMLSLGFSHSGYSEKDPDGKNALLTVSIQVHEQDFTPDEKNTLESEGVRIAPASIRVQKPLRVEIDIALPESPVEEARIRNSLQLPKVILVSSGSVPFQVSWKGIPGQTLHRWLTSERGFRVLLRYEGEILWTPVQQPFISKSKLEEWWTARHGNSTDIQVPSGPVGVAFDILNFASLLPATVNPFQLSLSEALLVGRANEVLNSVGQMTNPPGSFKVSRTALVSADWEGLSAKALRMNIGPRSTLQPGLELEARPQLVKDLSGDGVGLDPLRNDKD